MLEYKGYYGFVKIDTEAHIFHGEVVNTNDVITFQGKSVDELEKAFIDSIEDYLEWCREDGIVPEKPYSGKFNLRISPELHKNVAISAKMLNMSINKFVEKAVVDELNSIAM
ncbi:MAG: type II toxin-antitoxin system HicB family antitoxin [Desulfovibrionales bacterium]|nr:type II toxin-antitoxin system HicB family antitoxin [Desulfovibrionales bacterium]